MNSTSSPLALITGGSSGIGHAIADVLAREGYDVVIIGRNEKSLQKTADSIDGNVYFKKCDVADRSNVEDLYDWLHKELRSPDVLVNSAGINVRDRMMANVDPKEFDEVMAVNVTGTFNCIHGALPAMRERGKGTIINIVSVAGRRAMLLAGMPYCVSKSAQSTLGTFVNLEEAKNGIKLTNIYPGETNTPLVDQRPVVPPEEKRAAMLQPEDIAVSVLSILQLPARAVVPELILTPPYMMLD